MTPDPSHNSQTWCSQIPSAERKKPPLQQHAATTPALRGPSRSSQGPNTAADDPSITKNSVYIQPRVLTRQSPGAGAVMPMARLSGSQKTLKDVVEFYDRGGVPNPNLDPAIRPLGLTPEERASLVAFLRSL